MYARVASLVLAAALIMLCSLKTILSAEPLAPKKELPDVNDIKSTLRNRTALINDVGVLSQAQKPQEIAGPPEIAVASIKDGKLEIQRFAKRSVTRSTDTKPGVRVELQSGVISATEVVSVGETHSLRLTLREVKAQRINGQDVSFDTLADELAKPTPVVLLFGSKVLDPIFVKIFNPATLILRLPAPKSRAPTEPATPPANSVPPSDDKR
jgi:hypothetical protein